MATNIAELENKLWSVEDQLWANTELSPRELSRPLLGLLFLWYVE